ncbi:MAG: hypothetical protein P1P82_09705 [Bacteroidales bacterium]|nr:hypothetical protein [Bacteroidales bacterium]
MKSRTAFILLFVLLLAAAGLVWLLNPWSTTGSGLSVLLPQEPDKVTGVQVIGEFDTLAFHRSDTVWMLDGEEMNPGALENLVYAASRLTMRSILPAGEVRLTGPAVEVLFLKGSREAGHFFFAASSSGYVVYAPGANQYFGVEIPGYEGLALEKIFSVNADHYRMHLLADLLPSEIASVAVEPWKGTAFVAQQDSGYNVSVRLPETGEDVTGEVDEHKIRMLFSYFNTIRYDRVAGPTEADPGNLPSTPWARVVVTTFDGVRRQFDVYQWVKPGEQDPDLFEALVVFNGRPLLLVVNYYYLDLLVRGLEDYRR